MNRTEPGVRLEKLRFVSSIKKWAGHSGVEPISDCVIRQVVTSRVIKKIGRYQIHAERKAHGVKLKTRLSCLTTLYHARYMVCRQRALSGVQYETIFTPLEILSRWVSSPLRVLMALSMSKGRNHCNF